MNYFLTTTNVLFAITIIGILFNIYRSYKDPQTSSEKDSIKLTDRVATLELSIKEVREQHLKAVETDLKNLNITLQKLSETVVKLSTIIDERIPRSIK